MKSTPPIIFTRNPKDVPGYELYPFEDGAFWYDTDRVSYPQVDKVANAMEDSDWDYVYANCDFCPMPWWDEDLGNLVRQQATGLNLSEN